MLDLTKISKKKSEAIANGVFLIAIGILFFTNYWWPGILLAIWASLALRQYFSGRIYDLCISSVILLGLFASTYFDFEWSVLVPVIFVIAGIYVIFREYFFSEDTNGEDKAEEILDDSDIGKDK